MKRIMSWPLLFVGWAQQKLSRMDDVGASLVEYGLLLALIAVVAIGALVFLGHSVGNTLNQVGSYVNNTNTATNGVLPPGGG